MLNKGISVQSGTVGSFCKRDDLAWFQIRSLCYWHPQDWVDFRAVHPWNTRGNLLQQMLKANTNCSWVDNHPKKCPQPAARLVAWLGFWKPWRSRYSWLQFAQHATVKCTGTRTRTKHSNGYPHFASPPRLPYHFPVCNFPHGATRCSLLPLVGNSIVRLIANKDWLKRNYSLLNLINICRHIGISPCNEKKCLQRPSELSSAPPLCKEAQKAKKPTKTCCLNAWFCFLPTFNHLEFGVVNKWPHSWAGQVTIRVNIYMLMHMQRYRVNK